MKILSRMQFLLLALLLLIASPAFAETLNLKLETEDSDLNLGVFANVNMFPMSVSNLDFNSGDTGYDWMLEEGGVVDNDAVTIRNQLNLGLTSSGKNWSFSTMFRGDFMLTQQNVDRGKRVPDNLEHLTGFEGEDFGIERLKIAYDFTSHGLPATFMAGWNLTGLDLETGGILFGDDHPYMKLKGKYKNIGWETAALFINDWPGSEGLKEEYQDMNAADGSAGDWRAYTAKLSLPVQDLNIAPMYAFSNNQVRNAAVHYMGVQAFGQVGILNPKAEFVYALGEKENFTDSGKDADISAYGGFASVKAKLSDMLNPYLGGYMFSGDDDANDDEIEAYNPITNLSRFSGPFGMQNAMIYRLVPVLGSPIHGNNPSRLGGANSGYGGVVNDSSAYAPGMYSLGIGTDGSRANWSYQAQVQYFWFAETGALEDLASGKKTIASENIDSAIGYEADLQLSYNFSDNFSLGNVISVFDPGDGIQDLRGNGFDDTAVVNTVEIKWNL